LNFCDVTHPEPAQFAALLRAWGMETSRLAEAIARRHGISTSELQALGELDVRGGLTPGQLAARLGMTSGAVTALADRLERHGLVERRPHPTDRRSTLLCPTAQAHGFGAASYGPLGADMGRLLAAFDPAERDAIARFLAGATEIAAAHADQQATLSPAGPRARRGS